jgi:branched-chain amino acid transport system substrate-binding protein
MNLLNKKLCLFGLLTCFAAIVPDPATGEQPVSLVLILAQSGIAAEDNRPAAEAAQLAVDEVNVAGGLLGCPLKLSIIDNQSTPLGSNAAAQQAVNSEAAAVVGAIWSSHCLAMAPVLQAAGMPMVTPTASMPAVTLTGDYIFRACFIDSFQGKVMAQFARTNLSAKTAGIFINVNQDYSQELARFFETAFADTGGKVVWKGNYTGSAVDFNQLLRSAAGSGVDIFFLPGYARDAGLLLKQGRKLGLSQTFLGGDGWGTQIYEYATDALDGCYYSTHWHPDTNNEKSRALLVKYRKRYPSGEVNDIRIPLTYDAVMLVADAVTRSGSTDHKRVRDALATTIGFQGATGTITFDGNGDPIDKQAAIIKWEGHRQMFKKTVQP